MTSQHDGHRRIVAARDQAAARLGLHAGMPLSHAQAMIPDLAIVEADPEADSAALADAAAWCLRYAPLASPDPPDGILLDATGCAHLFGGERAMLEDLRARFARAAIAARVAIADTPGAAWAIARHGGADVTVVPPGAGEPMLAPLAVSALRLPTETVAALRRLGFETVGQLAAAPRAPLRLRFDAVVLRRLDQASGRMFEPITPVFPAAAVESRLGFVEPLLTAEAFAEVIGRLARTACAALERSGQGARQLDLVFERVDGTIQAVRVGTARPSHAAPHLARLLTERLEQVDPGLGVEAMRLVVTLAEPLDATQPGTGLLADGPEEQDVSALIDRLVNRLGERRVTRAEPVESDLPERSVRRVPALAPRSGRTWPPTLPRPVRLFDPPQPVQAMALLPDQPPVQFVWRRVRHRVRRTDGPERVFGEWWKHPAEIASVRDYFAVEDEAGARFWLFRQGDGVDPSTGDLRWFLHGLF